MVMILAGFAVLTSFAGAGAALYQFDAALHGARQSELRHEVEAVASLAHGLANSETSKDLATARLVELLRPSRFGDHGYYFIQDLKGTALLMPTKTDLEGKDITDLKDATGRHFFQDMLALAKNGQSGVVDYVWPKPGESEPKDKASFVAPIPELGLLIGTGAYTDDIRGEVLGIFWKFSLIVAPLLVAMLVLSVLIGRNISRRLRQATIAMERLAAGDFDVALPGLDRKDEIGGIVRAVDGFKHKLIESARREEAQRDSQRRAAAEARRADMLALAQHFEAAVGAVVAGVASSAQEMEAIARSLVDDARRAGEQATLGAEAAATTSQNIQSVAAATEELSHSAVEIGQNTSQSQKISLAAATVAEKTHARMSELDESIQHIDGIAAMISGIAEQTNMLALNATIEAARAGEAGRGFAVVASEVKTLADQTQKATADISAKIANIRKASHEASDCIREMSGATHEVSELSSSIGGAIDMQGQATRDIAQSIHDTSQLAGNLARVVEEVREASRHTGVAAEETLMAVSQLAEQAEMLRVECDGFLAKVRAA